MPAHRHRRQPHPRPHRRIRQGHGQGLHPPRRRRSLTAPRTPNGEWVDGPPTYYWVTVFGKTAKNATNSLTKGNTVLVTGELTVRSYTRTDGTPGIAHEIIADHLGAALTHTTVTINRKNTAQTS